MENIKAELLKDADDIVSQIDAFRNKVKDNLSSDSNLEGALKQTEKEYNKCFYHDVETIKSCLEKDVVFWKKKMDQAQLAPKKIQANISKFLVE